MHAISHLQSLSAYSSPVGCLHTPASSASWTPPQLLIIFDNNHLQNIITSLVVSQTPREVPIDEVPILQFHQWPSGFNLTILVRRCRRPRVGNKCVLLVVKGEGHSWESLSIYGCGYEFEVADTEGSTATGAPPLKNQEHTMCVSVCPHTTKLKMDKRQKECGRCDKVNSF
jgi:hypothetical protein